MEKSAPFFNELRNAMRLPINTFLQKLLDDVHKCIDNFVDNDLWEFLEQVSENVFIDCEGSSDTPQKCQDYLQKFKNRLLKDEWGKAKSVLKPNLQYHFKENSGMSSNRDRIFQGDFLNFFRQNMKSVLGDLKNNLKMANKIVEEFTKEENLKERMLFGSLESTLEQLRKFYSRQLKTLRKFIAPQGAIFKHSPISLIKVFYSVCSQVCSSHNS